MDSDALEQASESFVMVNLEDDEEPQDPEFKPDGGYIPRLLFLDSQGKIHSEIFNEEGRLPLADISFAPSEYVMFFSLSGRIEIPKSDSRLAQTHI